VRDQGPESAQPIGHLKVLRPEKGPVEVGYFILIDTPGEEIGQEGQEKDQGEEQANRTDQLGNALVVQTQAKGKLPFLLPFAFCHGSFIVFLVFGPSSR